MNFYLLFIVFLYVGGCNARVVPLNFKLDRCKRFVPSTTENEVTDATPNDKAENLGHNLPDIGQSKDLELLNSKEDNATVPEISNRNTSNLSADLTPEEKAVGEDVNLKRNESSVIYYDVLEELNSTSEFNSENNSDSLKSSQTIQENGALNNTSEDMIFKNEESISNNSPLDLEQGDNLDFMTIVEKELNDTLDPSETSEVVESYHNETFAYFEVVKSDQNETSTTFEVEGTNSTDFFELQPLSNDTKVEVFISDAENATEKFESKNLTSENLEQTNDSATSSDGIFSGFEFLINSEVARNAAKAIQVFNFSDPLTDHIMEENEFHSFLPAFNTVQDLDSSSETNIETTTNITNSSGEFNEIQVGFNASLPFGDETSIELNEAKPERNSSIPFNLSDPLVEGSNTEMADLEEKFEENATSDLSSALEKSEEKVELSSESTITKENVKDSDSNSSDVGIPECPPAGWCIFSFLSQDTCAVNEHCLGSRICCKIGCYKTCIEVKSP